MRYCVPRNAPHIIEVNVCRHPSEIGKSDFVRLHKGYCLQLPYSTNGRLHAHAEIMGDPIISSSGPTSGATAGSTPKTCKVRATTPGYADITRSPRPTAIKERPDAQLACPLRRLPVYVPISPAVLAGEVSEQDGSSPRETDPGSYGESIPGRSDNKRLPGRLLSLDV